MTIISAGVIITVTNITDRSPITSNSGAIDRELMLSEESTARWLSGIHAE